MKGELVNIYKETEKKEFDKDTFLKASLFSRFLIVLSGPLANLILGCVLIIGLYFFNGRYVSPPIINEVIASKPAVKAGIASGDKILSINDKKFYQKGGCWIKTSKIWKTIDMIKIKFYIDFMILYFGVTSDIIFDASIWYHI